MATRNRDGSFHRVQVRDLSDPQQIRPAPLKRDIYHKPAKPVVDTSKYDNLVAALGIAKSLVGPLTSAAAKGQEDAKKQAADDMWRQWNKYLSTNSQSAVLEDIRNGRERFSSDPYIGAAVRKHYGSMEARALASEIDEGIASGEVPFGTQQFNPEQFILDRARPYVDRLGGNREVISSFRKGLDGLRAKLTDKHQKALGVAQTRHIENIASDLLEGSIEDGVEKGLNGVQILDEIRTKIYPDIGPRINGGSLDLKRGRLDELLLDAIERKLEDPEEAHKFTNQALEAIHSNRKDPRTGQNLGSLSQVERHKEQTRRIAKKARKVAGEFFEKSFKESVLSRDTEALRQGKGLAFRDIREESPVLGQSEITISSRERKERALAEISREARERAGVNVPVPSEIATYIRNGHKHEEVASTLEGAVRGFLNMELDVTSSDLKEERGARLEKIVEASSLYQTIKDISPSATNWVDKSTKDFYENYTAALNSGMANGDPMRAAEIAHRIHNNGDRYNTAIAGSEIDAAMRSIDIPGDHQGYLWDSSVGNMNEVQKALKDNAQRYMRAGGMGAEEALEKAVEDVNKTSVVVNGRAIIGDPYITKEDAPHIKTLIEAFHKKYKPLIDNMGLEEEDISVSKSGRGDYVFVHNETGQPIHIPSEIPILELYSPEDRAALAQLGEEQANLEDYERPGSRGFTSQDIIALRNEAEPSKEQAIRKAVKRRVDRLGKKEEIRKELLRKSQERRERELERLENPQARPEGIRP